VQRQPPVTQAKQHPVTACLAWFFFSAGLLAAEVEFSMTTGLPVATARPTICLSAASS